MYIATKNYSEKDFLDMILKNKDNIREQFLERNEKMEISLAQKHEINALFYQEVNPELRFQHYNKNTLFRLETISKNVLIAKDTPSYLKLTNLKNSLFEYHEKTKSWYFILNDTRYKIYTDFFHEFDSKDEEKKIISKHKQIIPIFIIEKESETTF
jgi:hypothetical protein